MLMEKDPNPSPLDRFTSLLRLPSTSSAALRSAAAIQLCCCPRRHHLSLCSCRRPSLQSLKAPLAGSYTISRMSKSQTKYLNRLMRRENMILEQSREIVELKQELLQAKESNKNFFAWYTSK
jgi:hypothetical protein